MRALITCEIMRNGDVQYCARFKEKKKTTLARNAPT